MKLKHIILVSVFSVQMFALGMLAENRRLNKTVPWDLVHVMTHVYDNILEHGTSACLNFKVVSQDHEDHNIAVYFQDGCVGQFWWDSNLKAVGYFCEEPRNIQPDGRYERQTKKKLS